MPKQYDVVVVGAGLGGLSVATLLAKKGASVLLLERHNVPGGYATSFVRGRYEFEVALHELSGIGPPEHRGPLYRYLDSLGVASQLEFSPIGELYRSVFPDLDVTLPVGEEAGRETLCDTFPHEARGIRRFLDRIQGGQLEERDLNELKHQLHNKVIDRLDLKVVQQLSREELRFQLKDALERQVQAEGLPLSPAEAEVIVSGILDEIMGLGPLEVILADAAVSDVLVNGPHHIYVEKGGKLELTDVRFRDNEHLLNTINRIVAHIGRRIDESSPMVDARLKDGSRVNAIIPPLALDGPAMSIRRFGDKKLGPEDLIRFGSISPHMVQYLQAAVKSKINVLVSGGTGSGPGA